MRVRERKNILRKLLERLLGIVLAAIVLDVKRLRIRQILIPVKVVRLLPVERERNIQPFEHADPLLPNSRRDRKRKRLAARLGQRQHDLVARIRRPPLPQNASHLHTSVKKIPLPDGWGSVPELSLTAPAGRGSIDVQPDVRFL